MCICEYKDILSTSHWMHSLKSTRHLKETFSFALLKHFLAISHLHSSLLLQFGQKTIQKMKKNVEVIICRAFYWLRKQIDWIAVFHECECNCTIAPNLSREKTSEGLKEVQSNNIDFNFWQSWKKECDLLTKSFARILCMKMDKWLQVNPNI